MASAPYSMKLASSHSAATFSRAVRMPSAWRFATASARFASSVNAWRAMSSCRSARHIDGSAPGAAGGAAVAAAVGDSVGAAPSRISRSPSATSSPARTLTASTRASASAQTSCSIFIASRISSG